MDNEQQKLTVSIEATDSGAVDSAKQLDSALAEVENRLGDVAEAARQSGQKIVDNQNNATQIIRTVGAAQMAVIDDLKARFADSEKLIEQGADKFVEGEKKKQEEIKRTKAELAEVRKQQQELAYLVMDIGYIVPGGQALSNVAYLMRDITSVSPAMIAGVTGVVAALAAVAGAAVYMEDAVKNAAKEETTLAELGNSIRNQGGDWDKARAGVEQWAGTLGRATTFSKNEALTALNDLTERGIGYADAQRIVNVATDVAAAKHQDLIKVVDQLVSAEGARASGLIKYDTNLKRIIQSHGTLQQVMDQLAKDYAGEAASATETFEGKQKLLKDVMEETSTEVGVHLLPVMEGLSSVFIGITEEAEKNSAAIGQWGVSFVDTLTGVADGIHNLFSIDPFAGARQHAVNVGTNWLAGGENLVNKVLPGFFSEDEIPQQVDTSQAFKYGPSPGPFKNNFANEAWRNAQAEQQKRIEEFARIRSELGTKLDHDMTIGASKGAGGTGAPPVEVADKAAIQAEKLISVQEKLKGQLEALTAGEAQYKLNVELATTADSQQDAEMALKQKIVRDAGDAIKDINAANKALNAEITALTPKQREQNAAYEDAVTKQNAFVASLHGGKAATTGQRETLHTLNATVSQTWSAYNSTTQALHTLNQELDSNNKRLETQKHNQEAAAIAMAAIDRSYNNAIIANHERNDIARTMIGMSLEQQLAKWQKLDSLVDSAHYSYADNKAHHQQYQTQEDNVQTQIAAQNYSEQAQREQQIRQLQDEEATYNMSLEQQKRYYMEKLETQVVSDEASRQEYNRLWSEVVKLEGDTFKQRADAHKALVKGIEQEETTLLDNILTKHASFRDDLKTILTDIENNYKKMFENMILADLNKAGGVNEALASALSPSGGGGSKGSGLFAGLASLGAASGKPDGTAGSPLHVTLVDGPGGGKGGASSLVSDASQYGILGLHLGSAGASTAIASLPTNAGLLGLIAGNSPATNAAAAGNVEMTPEAAKALGLSGPTGSSAKSVLGTALANAGIGFGLASALNPGGNQTDAGIGDMLGTLAGTLTKANPVAGAALAIGGSIIGGLFGPHNTPEQTPDTSQPGYQQWLANYEGRAQNSHGQITFAQGQYDTSIGNQSVAQQIAKYINDPSAWASAPAGVKAAIQQLLPLEGGTGSLDLNLSDPERQGNLNFASGKQMGVTQFQTLLSTVQQGMGASGDTSGVYNLSRSYPTFTSSLSKVGDYTSNPNAQTDAYGNPVSGSTGGSGLRTTMSGGVNVTVNLNNTVGAIPDDVVNQIVPKIRDAVSGFIPGGYTVSLSQMKIGN